MKRGRPFEPGNKFGRGRPRGSRNKRTLIAQQLLDEHAEPIVRKAMILALQGDSRLLQSLLSYILPRRKDAPLKTAMLRTATTEELSESFEQILKKVSSGEITLSQARELVVLMEARRDMVKTEEFDKRLRVVEKIAA
jgi:hypothetical protein